MIQITKYDNLTDEELIREAYASLGDDDELGIALLDRLMDKVDELEEKVAGYQDEVDYWIDVCVRLKEKVSN